MQWAQAHFLNYRSLRRAVDIRNQLAEILEREEIQMRSCFPRTEPVLKALVAGCFLNIAKQQAHPIVPDINSTWH